MKRLIFSLLVLAIMFPSVETFAQHPRHPKKVRVIKKYRHHCKHPNCFIVRAHHH